MLSSLELGILAPAFVAGTLVVSTHIPLGRQVLHRGIIFIDLAVAQMVGLGVIGANLLGWEPGGWATQVVGMSAALLGSALMYLLGRRLPQSQEALIGVSFVLAASASILLLAANPHGGEHLRDLLAGQILWTTYADLIPAGLLYGALLLIWLVFRQRSQTLLFYLLFALAVTASVQLVGVYLVFATLIIPALAARNAKRPLLSAYIVGISGYAVGLPLSAVTDLPSGAVVVWTLALVGILSAVLRHAGSSSTAQEQ